MIFKTVIGFFEFIIVNFDISDETVVVLVEGVVSHDANAVDFFAIGLHIILSKKLEAAANS